MRGIIFTSGIYIFVKDFFLMFFRTQLCITHVIGFVAEKLFG